MADGEWRDTSFGYITNVSTLGDLKVEFTASYSYFDNQPGTLEFGPNGEEPSVRIEGFSVVDDDGEELDAKGADGEPLLKNARIWRKAK